MSTVRSFVRREPVLVIAALAAVLSCCFVPPDRDYIAYLDLRTLALLYCLMTIVNGLRQAGLFAHLAHSLCERAGSLRRIGLLLVLLCFFSSMLITNDVALLTFVPFAVVVMGMAHHRKELLYVVVLQTVAANLGSMLTPVGNPQNLYLYSFYDFAIGDFLKGHVPGVGAFTAAVAARMPCSALGAAAGLSRRGAGHGSARGRGASRAVCRLPAGGAAPAGLVLDACHPGGGAAGA